MDGQYEKDKRERDELIIDCQTETSLVAMMLLT